MKKIRRKHTVSAIVPAYNEEQRVADVLSVLIKSTFVDEAICVDDGSLDQTTQVARSIDHVHVVRFRKNRGKSSAVTEGIRRTRGEIVLLFDADIGNLKETHIRQLAQPLLQEKADGVIGYLDRDYLPDKVFRPLSGIRSYYRKDLLPFLPVMEDKGYRLELFLNYKFRNKNIRTVPLKGILHTSKLTKQPIDKSLAVTAEATFAIFDEILHQKNPPGYFYETYLYLFYLKQLKNGLRQTDRAVRGTIDRLLSYMYD